MIYGIAYKLVNNYQDAEDITQDAFLIIFKKLKSLKKSNSLTAWIYTITLNLVRKKYRERYRKSYLYKTKNYSLLSNDEKTNDNREKIEVALDKLSPNQKKGVILKYLDGLKIKEISKIMNCKEGTVKVLYTETKEGELSLMKITPAVEKTTKSKSGKI